MTTTVGTTDQVYELFIKASPEQVWDAIIEPEFTLQYFHGVRIEITPERRLSGSADGSEIWDENAVLEWDPPRRLCTSGTRSTTPSWRQRRRAASRGRSRRRTAASRS